MPNHTNQTEIVGKASQKMDCGRCCRLPDLNSTSSLLFPYLSQLQRLEKLKFSFSVSVIVRYQMTHFRLMRYRQKSIRGSP